MNVPGTDSLYQIYVNVTDEDGDTVHSDMKVFYVCDNLASSGTGWTCEKADFDQDGWTEGVHTDLYGNTSMVCDMCPGQVNTGLDRDADGIDDVCDVAAPTELNIWDDSDIQTKYVTETVKFYANYTNASSGGPMENATCIVSFNVSEYGPFTMVYNNASGYFEYARTFQVIGTHSWNVSCTQTEYQSQFREDTVEINPIPTMLDITYTDLQNNPRPTVYPGDIVRFWANYRTYINQPIDGADCNISFNVSEYGPLNMSYYGSGRYFYDRTFDLSGLYIWNVTCTKLYHQTQIKNDTINVSVPLAQYLNLKLTVPGTSDDLSFEDPYYSVSKLDDDTLFALVFHSSTPESATASETTQNHTIELTLWVEDSEAFLVFTKGEEANIKNRLDLIESLEFMTHISPSFGFGLGLYHPIKVLIEFTDIDIVSNLLVSQGSHEITFDFNETVGDKPGIAVIKRAS